MLSKEQIEKNKVEFLNLIQKIDIPGSDIQGLVDYIMASDFFTAPASTNYHNNFEGGLCDHSLNVFRCLKTLADTFKPNEYDESSIIAVSLLHDISKINFYEKYIMNKKIYSDKGTKHDNQGNFDWFAEEAYKVKDNTERFLAGEHGVNSLLIAARFIPFNLEESSAIINHHFISDTGSTIKDITPIYNKYGLAALLHLADMASVYLIENKK